MTATATDQQNAGNVRHERQARSVAIDFLRAIAILAVVSVHTLPVPLLGASLANSGKIINGGGISLDSVLSATSLSDSSSTLISAIIGSTSKVGVPLFLIISGYLMLDRDYTGPKLKRFLMHNYLPMFVSFECWCAIAFLSHFAANRTLQTVADFLRTMLFIDEPAMIHFWYMQMLLGIYLLIPVLACFLRHPQLQQDVTSSTSIKQNTEQKVKHGSKKTSLLQHTRYIILLAIIGTAFILVLPTIQTILTWFNVDIDYEITLGGCVGHGSLGLLYMLFGYLLKKDVFHISSRKTSLWLLIAAAVLLWLVSALELRLTNELFLVTAGFFPIAFFAFALSNAAIYSTFWKHCPGWLSTAMTGLASYSYGIYMVHPIIAQVLRALIPDSMHLLRVASLNTVSILLFSLLAVFIIARIRPLRKWLLLIK